MPTPDDFRSASDWLSSAYFDALKTWKDVALAVIEANEREAAQRKRTIDVAAPAPQREAGKTMDELERAIIARLRRSAVQRGERLCGRCQHPDHWHRHDDEACLVAHPQPCSPNTAPFRCLGYDCAAPGFAAGTPETRCGCPDFVEPEARDE